MNRVLYGYRVESEVPLARLRSGEHPRGRITVVRAARELLDEQGELIQVIERIDGDGLSLAIARTDDALLLWCEITGTFRLEADRLRIWSDASEPAAAWEDRILNAVIPLLLIDRGELMLHAAAVRTAAGAVIVCGPSGRGKSTLAAALADAGMQVLAEDSVAVTLDNQRPTLWPGPVGVRLDEPTAAALGLDARTLPLVRGKQLYLPDAEDRSSAPVPVSAIVRLDRREGSALQLSPLSEAEALAGVFPSVYRVEPDSWRATFHRAGNLVRGARSYAASLPEGLDALPEAARQLIERVTDGQARLRAA